MPKPVCAAVLLAAMFFAVQGDFVAAHAAQGPRRAPKCTAEQGQRYIDEGAYDRAIREFTCVIEAQPKGFDGYRGRGEAELLLGRYSDANKDYVRITALILPEHPEAEAELLASYDARLAAAPHNIAALTGASFAEWYFFDYPAAIHLLNTLLDVSPNDRYGNLFRGSSRLLKGASREAGAEDLERAIALDPANPNVRFIVADAYTYGQPDPQRAFDEATLALNGGLDTPRVHAILAAAYFAFNNPLAAAEHIQRHIDLVTTELVTALPLPAGSTRILDLVAGRTFEIPLPATAGQTISIRTSSSDFWDTIMVLRAPNGTLVTGSDDFQKYFAGLDWAAEVDGIYKLEVTSFEGASTGELVVTRN